VVLQVHRLVLIAGWFGRHRPRGPGSAPK
jgi:hypothetical protein